MIVPDISYPPGSTYPQGEAVIWVPKDTARNHYLTQTTFYPSPLGAQGIALATPADVNTDLTKYGYRFSTKPPAYIPEIDYSSYGEEPIYPFIGQMVPGTNVQYTDPTIPPVWLVDIASVSGQDVVIPALTTIDFTKFMSINWPRERYISAIEKARNGQADEILSGTIPEINKTFSGVIKVTGDVLHALGGGGLATFSRGTVLVTTAKSSDYDTGGSTENPNRINFDFWENTYVNGSEQRPVILTCDAEQPAGDDWYYFASGQISRFQMSHSLIEYGRIGIWVAGISPQVERCIIRYTENSYPFESLQGTATAIVSDNAMIQLNEIHSVNVGIWSLKKNAFIEGNSIYGTSSLDAKGLFVDKIADPTRSLTMSRNTVIRMQWGGLCTEGYSDSDIYLHENMSVLNVTGVMMYHWPGEYSTPRLEGNDVWANYCPWAANPEEGPSNFVRGNEVEGHYIIHDYDTKNESHDPSFRNVKIFDLAHDTDNDGLYSDIETNTGTYESPTDTGTDSWNPDTDDDGLTDGQEVLTYLTNPLYEDTDLDGVNDGVEIHWGCDPLNPDETPELPAASLVGILILSAGIVTGARKKLRH